MRRQSRFRENVSSRAGSVSVFWQHAPLFWWSAGSASVFWLYALLCLAVRWLGQCFLAVCAFVFGGLLAPPPFFGSMRICFWWFAGSASVFWQHARLFLVIRWLQIPPWLQFVLVGGLPPPRFPQALVLPGGGCRPPDSPLALVLPGAWGAADPHIPPKL